MLVLAQLLLSLFLSAATPALGPGEVVGEPQAVVAVPADSVEPEVQLDLPAGFGLGLQLSERLQVDMQGVADDVERGVFVGVSFLF